MREKCILVAARASAFELLAVKSLAAAKGQTVSQLIRETIIEKAVKPIRDAAQEVCDGDLQTPAHS